MSCCLQSNPIKLHENNLTCTIYCRALQKKLYCNSICCNTLTSNNILIAILLVIIILDID